MIRLGCHDSGTPESVCKDLLKRIGETTRIPLPEIEQGRDKLELEKYGPDARA